jgi:nucleotide-binding universal stress UspA family protein
MYTKIIVPLDGSALAESVLPHVVSIAKSSGTEEVILITVTERFNDLVRNNVLGKPSITSHEYKPAVAFADRPYSGRPFEIDKTLKIPLVSGKILKQGQVYLTKVAEQLVNKGIKTGIAVLMGDAAEQIVDFAGAEKADLIIMASHGRSGFSRWALGSVAYTVFHGSSVPILLVKNLTEELKTE